MLNEPCNLVFPTAQSVEDLAVSTLPVVSTHLLGSFLSIMSLEVWGRGAHAADCWAGWGCVRYVSCALPQMLWLLSHMEQWLEMT
jgi:hypothetical protein